MPTRARRALAIDGTVSLLGHYPADAGSAWPLLQETHESRIAPSRFEVDGVGPGATPRVREARARAGLTLTGAVSDVAPVYERASAVVVPVRAGGGTRIKVVEAFAHRRPVVSTGIGCRGLDVRDEIRDVDVRARRRREVRDVGSPQVMAPSR